MTRRFTLTIFVLTSVGVAAGLIMSKLAEGSLTTRGGVGAMASISDAGVLKGQLPGAVHFSYEALPSEEMVKNADAILMGRVTSIGQTKWNQDSGDYWEATLKDDLGDTTVVALPYFEVTLSSEHIIADPRGMATPETVVTLLGASHASDEVVDEELGLKVGDTVIAFLRQGEIAWWGGKIVYDKGTGMISYGMKPVLQLMGVPNQSYMLQNVDGSFQFSTRPEQLRAYSLAEFARLVEELRTSQ